MIAFVKGILAGRSNEAAIIETGGIGILVRMSLTSLQALPEIGKRVQVCTYLQVREDALALYGFVTQEERALFEQLIGVSGIGPKVALSALSAYKPADLSRAIMGSDVATVSRIPGIGKKTAQRIILELKGTLEKEASLFESVAVQDSVAIKQATEDLLAMGFTLTEAELALKGAPADAAESTLLTYALKQLGS